MRISDWSSDVCSSDLQGYPGLALWLLLHGVGIVQLERLRRRYRKTRRAEEQWIAPLATALQHGHIVYLVGSLFVGIAFQPRSEEPTSELQSLMRSSYAVFCLENKQYLLL